MATKGISQAMSRHRHQYANICKIDNAAFNAINKTPRFFDMVLGSFRGIASKLFCIGVVWMIFLFIVHLILDFEQSRKYFKPATSNAQGHSIFSLDDLDFIEDDDFQERKEKCDIPFDHSYPDCKNQVQRLKEIWSKDTCFRDFDVDGSDCSIIIYLSEVESWCPRLFWRRHMTKKERRKQKAYFTDNMDDLMMLLGKPELKPLATRAFNMWRYWKSGYRFMKKDVDGKERNLKKILIYIGSLTNLPSNTSTSQPLTDDLVQWSDLITSLFILGHKLIITDDKQELISLLTTEGFKRRCKSEENLFNLIYTDHVGMRQLVTSQPEIRDKVWRRYKCKFRVLDAFGTEAELNYANYNESLLPGGRSPLGNLELSLRQLMTKFPMSPDNSFLGFAAGSHLEKRPFLKKKKRIVIYGDESSIYKNHTFPMYEFASKFMRVHAAVVSNNKKVLATDSSLPSYVINHGVLKSEDLDRLIAKSKAVIGLGAPSEGVLPVAAVGKGCVFINPKYNSPKDRLNSDFLKDKPSLRQVASQHPYLEKFVRRPHVITLDLNNMTEVKQAIRKIAKTKVRTYIPFEFTTEGFLQRINAYVDNQDFCHQSDWPPVLELQIKIGTTGKSCHDVCTEKGLVCEPEYFKAVNSTKIHGCRITHSVESVFAPAKEANSTNCITQIQPLLFNCIRSSPRYRRVCPCRTYKTGQRSLCEEC